MGVKFPNSSPDLIKSVMVSSRGIPSSSSLLRLRFIRPFSISVYVLVLFAFSAALFLFSHRQIAEVDRPPLVSKPPPFVAEPPPFVAEPPPVVAEQPPVVAEPPPAVSEKPLRNFSPAYGYRPCVKPTHRYEAPQDWKRYLTVRSNGGLNQMRTGISDMVAVARIMNATLVIPQLDKRSFWQDSSTFSDIFDETHFINFLQGDVHIVRALPKELESTLRARKHFTSWSGVSYYEEMAKLWKDYQVIHVPKSDSRLANNDLPLDIQRLRCRALYQALRFSPPIESLGKCA